MFHEFGTFVHASACTNVPNSWNILLGGASDDGQILRPKHVQQNKEK
jgi:hypothetical protein